MRRIEDDRPLTWETLTGPSRIMVPYYFAASAWAGTIYLFDPQVRVARSPGLTTARWLVNGQMQWWGVMFLTLAAAILLSFATHQRRGLGMALHAGSVMVAMWTLFTAIAVWLNPLASLVAPMWLLGVALACRASARSVITREVP